jgi:hypothetical protein
MFDEYVIKHIGHRPVYRVVRDSVTGFLVGKSDDFRQTPPKAPLLDRDRPHHGLAGLTRMALADYPA